MNTPCCKPLEFALGRFKDTDRPGLFLEQNYLGKESDKNLMLRFRKGRKADEPGLYSASFIMVNYCPFCGKKVSP